MRLIDLEQNTDSWKSFRLKYIGSSDSPIIMNESPWCTPYQLWRRKLELDPPLPDTEAMKRGRELEPVARKYLEKEWGHNFVPIVGQSIKNSWQIASFDAWSPDLNHYVEIKCPGREDHQLAVEGKIPGKYLSQLLHQMLVAGTDIMTYMSYDGWEGVFIDIKISLFTPEYIDFLFQKEKEFYDFLMSKTTPPLVDRDYYYREDEAWKYWTDRYKQVKKEQKFYESQEEECRERLLELSGGSNCKGNNITLSKIVSKGRIAYDSIDELKNIDLERYRKPPTESWRFNVQIDVEKTREA